MGKLLACIFCLFLITSCQSKDIEFPNTDEPFLLISHVKEEILTFLNLDTFEVMKEESFPYQLHTLEKIDHKTVVFTGKLEESLYEWNMETGKIKEVYEFGQGILSLLYVEEAQRLFLTDAKNDTVHFFDYEKQELVASIPVGSYPTSLAINEEQTELYVLSSDANEIAVIDIKSQRVIHTFSTMLGSTTLFYDGQYLWVGGHGMYRDLNEFIYLYDPSTGKEVKKLAVGSMPIFFHEEKEHGYIAVLCHGSHELYIINRETYEVSENMKVGNNPYYMISDKTYLFVAGMDSHDVSIIDKKSFEVIKTVDLKDGPYAMTLGGHSDE